jgi:rod shape determining protein RodA
MLRRLLSISFKETFIGLGGGMFIITVLLVGMGILFIYSAAPPRRGFSASYPFRQMLWCAVAGVVFVLVVIVDYRRLLKRAWKLYWVGIGLLIITAIWGHVSGGARSWLKFGPIQLQTSEVMKLSLIVLLAHVLSTPSKQDSTVDMAIPFTVTALPVVFLLLQPDFGTALVFGAVVMVMVFSAGLSLRHLLLLLLTAVTVAPFLYQFGLHDYQKKRLLMFVFQNQMSLEEKRGAGYHLVQSKIAHGNGGLLGRGWRQGTQNSYGFLPERHTDFIFAVIGEEMGFLGTMVLLLIYIGLFFCMLISAYTATVASAQLIIIGIMTMLCTQTLINTCMTVGMAPITGLPLPFVSYGGSSLLFNFISIGLVVSINARKTLA